MRRSFAVALCVALASLAFVGPADAAVTPLPSDATLVVPGHGWGHGRGLGQYGAKGMAARGVAYAQILTHYYSGVSFGARSTSEDMRVLVEESPDVVVTSDAPFKIALSSGTAVATSDSTYRFFRARYNGSSYVIEKSGSHKGPWKLVKSSGYYVVFSRGSKFLQLVLDNSNVKIYRGKLIARRSPYTGMRAINQLLMQEYLYGVVPREMPASWPAEALKAQAVAARTYSAYKKDYARSKNYPYDICATTNCQAYFGYATKSSPTGSERHYENSTSNAAVGATIGKVLLYGGKPILAEYSSSTGGYTSPGSVPYQKAVPDADDAVSPYHDWRGVMRVSDIEKKYPSIGRLVDIVVTKRNGYGDFGGRVLNVELRGTAATAALSGDGFRGAFSGRGVRSTWFTVQIWRGELVSAPGSLSVISGDTATLVAQVKNTGNMSWYVGGPVRLGTAEPSHFYGPGWLSPTEAATVSRNVTDPSSSRVAGGQVGEFRIRLSTEGVYPGVYTETFKAVAQGYSTMAPIFTTQIQVLPGWTDEAANLVSNPSFESGLAGWKTSGFSSGDGRSSAARRIGSYSLRLAGAGAQSASQPVTFASGKSRRFVLAAWNKTNGTSSSRGPVEVRASVRYTDGSAMSVPLSFARTAHAWTYDERFFDTSSSKPLSSITVSASLKDQTGEAFFDGIRLLESPVANPSFEDGLAGWRIAGFVSGDGLTQTSARDGFRSLAMSGGAAKSAVQFAPLPARRGERFVVSAWNRSVGTNSSGPAPALNVMLIYTDGSRSVSNLPFAAAAHEWTRNEFVVKAAKDLRSAAITLGNANPSGSTFFDGIRVARTWTTNPSFEAGLAGWSPYGFRSGDGIVHANTVDGASALVLAGGGRQNARQRVTLSGGAGKRLVVSTWSRTVGTRSSSGRIEIMLTFRNADGTSTNVIVPIARSPHPWTYLERAVAAPKRFSAIDAYAIFYDETGTAYFDAVQIRNA